MIIYCLTNVNTGKKYVGKTKKDILVRFKQHIYNAFELKLDFYLYQSMRKHGADAFSYTILQECDNETELDECEKDWILKLETYKPTVGYNSTMGGDGGHITPETRAKISKANTGRVQTPEDRKKKSEAAKGRKHTKKSRQLIGEASKNRAPASKETRQKMSDAQKRAWQRRKKLKENIS